MSVFTKCICQWVTVDPNPGKIPIAGKCPRPTKKLKMLRSNYGQSGTVGRVRVRSEPVVRNQNVEGRDQAGTKPGSEIQKLS